MCSVGNLITKVTLNLALPPVWCLAIKRVTFYCGTNLLDLLDVSCARGGSRKRNQLVGNLSIGTLSIMTSIVTFNLHGFNNGFSMLKELCTSHDIIAVQEHWLRPDNLNELGLIDLDLISMRYLV